MTRSARLVPMTFLLAAVVAGCQRQTRPLSVAERQAIGDSVLDIAEAADRAVDNLDCEAGVASFADTRSLFVSNGMVIPTRDALARACARMIAGRTGAHYDITEATPHVLTRDIVYIVRQGKYTITYPDSTVTHELVISDIWQRRDGQWKRLQLHESGRPLN